MSETQHALVLAGIAKNFGVSIAGSRIASLVLASLVRVEKSATLAVPDGIERRFVSLPHGGASCASACAAWMARGGYPARQ